MSLRKTWNSRTAWCRMPARYCSWALVRWVSSSPRPVPTQGRRTGLTSPVCPRFRRVGRQADCEPAPGAPVPPILPPQDGFLLLDPSASPRPLPPTFLRHTRHHGGSQCRGALAALSGEVSVRPGSEAVLVRGCLRHRMIPPPAQRAMAQRAGCKVSEVAASHSLYVSRAKKLPRSSHSRLKPSLRFDRIGARSSHAGSCT